MEDKNKYCKSCEVLMASTYQKCPMCEGPIEEYQEPQETLKQSDLKVVDGGNQKNGNTPSTIKAIFIKSKMWYKIGWVKPAYAGGGMYLPALVIYNDQMYYLEALHPGTTSARYRLHPSETRKEEENKVTPNDPIIPL